MFIIRKDIVGNSDEPGDEPGLYQFKPGFFPDLPAGRMFEAFPTLEPPTRQLPLEMTGLNIAFAEQNPVLTGHNHGHTHMRTGVGLAINDHLIPLLQIRTYYTRGK